MPTIQINNETLTFNNIYYVSTTGNDTTGNGSLSLPYKTVYKAVGRCASSGDAVYALAGSYDVTYVSTETESNYKYRNYNSGGLYDFGKSISFIGQPNKTTFVCDGYQHPYRDSHCILTTGADTRIYNIKFNYWTGGRTSSYEIAIFGNLPTSVKAKLYNCIINCNEHVTMLYPVNSSCNVKVYNTVFKLIQNLTGNYDRIGSTVTLENCVSNFNISNTLGIKINTCLFNATINSNFEVTSAGAVNSGTGYDPDSSVADLGVYGGLFSWAQVYFLVKHGSDYKYYDGSSWVSIGSSLTTSLVNSYGMQSITFYPHLKLLSGEAEVNVIDLTRNKSRTLNYNAVPSKRLVKMNTNINFQYNITNFTTVFTSTGDKIKVIFSTDGGATWKSPVLTNGNYVWTSVTDTDLTDVENKGIKMSVLSNVPASVWDELGSSARLAYLFDMDTTTDVQRIDTLSYTGGYTKASPSLNSLTVQYQELDKGYYGLIFLDPTKDQTDPLKCVFTKADGTVLNKFDFGTLNAGQESDKYPIKIKNFLNYPITNLRISLDVIPSQIAFSLSKSNTPFDAQNTLIYEEVIQSNQEITFYVRLSTSQLALQNSYEIKLNALADLA